MRIFNIKRKRASLSLSLNAIVLLILAIAILGLGLTFIRGIFTGITAKVEEAVSAGEVINPPTRDNPVTITPSSVNLRKNEKGQIKVAFMNPQPGTRNYDLQIWGLDLIGTSRIECPVASSACEVNFVYHDSSLSINKDDINLYTIAIDPSSVSFTTDTKKTYVFTAKMICAVGNSTYACTTALPAVEYTRDFVVVVEQ